MASGPRGRAERLAFCVWFYRSPFAFHVFPFRVGYALLAFAVVDHCHQQAQQGDGASADGRGGADRAHQCTQKLMMSLRSSMSTNV
jgi:hypothetical protein